MMKEIKTEKFEGIAVFVGNDYYDFAIKKSEFLYPGQNVLTYKSPVIWDKYQKEGWSWETKCESGMEILGKSTELTEEQCANIIPSLVPGNVLKSIGVSVLYPMFNSDRKSLNAKTAFASLMQSIGAYSVNPYGEKEPEDISDLGAFTQMMRQKWKNWKQAQANTGTWLILRRVEG